MIHRKILLGCCFLCAVTAASATRADITYTRTTEDDHDWTVIRMTVTPAPEPVPALRHRLTVRSIDERPGNAALWYYRAMSGEGLDFQAKVRRNREVFGEERYHSWINQTEVPLAELPVDDVRTAFSRYWNELDNLREASARPHCDWQRGIENIRGPELVQVLLPELSQLRSFSRALILGGRLAIVERRYGDALEFVRINHQMAQHAASEPFLVSGLVGVAIAGIGNSVLTELIAVPDSPNLYWALSELPQPLVDLRDAARFELDFGPRMFPFIHRAETTDRAPQEWNRLYIQAVRGFSAVGPLLAGNWWRLPAGDETDAGVAATGLALIGYSHAKQQLIAEGMDREQVERMAVGQVIAIYTERIYNRFADDFKKLWYVPLWEMHERVTPVEQELSGAALLSDSPSRELLPLVQALMPAMHAARTAQVRLERDLAAMRVIEAMRMHAAANDGRLPATLDDITLVPVPLNPATGQPFAYRLDGQTAVLELPPSDRIPGHNRRFEIQIATKNQ